MALNPSPAKSILALACLQLLAMSAHAQTDELPPVKVIANTIATGAALDEVPANAQIIGGDRIRQQGTTNVADMLNNDLGSVSVSNGTGNPYQNDVAYRGFQATSLLGAPVGLSVYMDGVRMNEPFGAVVNWDLIPANAISSLNVLPGSNPMFGLNTLGGALVVNTKNGHDNPGTAISLTGGSFKRRAASLESGWADPAHGTDYFLSANLDRQDGWRWHSGSQVRQLYGKARWHDALTKAELSFALADNRLSGTQSLPEEMWSTPKSAYTYPDRVHNRMALLNLKLSREVGKNDLLTGNVFVRHVKSTSVNSNASWDEACLLPSGDAAPSCAGGNSLSAPGTALGLQGEDTPGISYTRHINTSLAYSSVRQNTVGANLNWTHAQRVAGHDNTLNVGASLAHSRITYGQDTALAQLVDYQVVPQPFNLQYDNPGGGQRYSALQDRIRVGSHSTDFSVYASDVLDVTDKLKLTAGGSFNVSQLSLSGSNQQFLGADGAYTWSDEASGANYFNPVYGSAPGAGDGAAYQAGPQISDLSGRHRFHRFNPALGFSYLATDQLNLFGGYSESMRAPTAIELACADPDHPCALPTGFNGDPPLKAVIARTFELGARGRLPTGTVWNAAVYQTRLRNDIQFQFDSAGRGTFANVGDTQRRGLELSLGHQFKQLFVGANYGYVDATYRSSWDNGAGAVSSGKHIPGIPRQSLKLRLAYQATPRFLAGGTVLLVGGQYAHGDEANQFPRVPGYGVVNLDLHYRFNDEWTLTGLVNNLFDKRYATYGVMGTSIYSGQFGQFRTPAAGRGIWLSLTYTPGARKPAPGGKS